MGKQVLFRMSSYDEMCFLKMLKDNFNVKFAACKSEKRSLLFMTICQTLIQRCVTSGMRILTSHLNLYRWTTENI